MLHFIHNVLGLPMRQLRLTTHRSDNSQVLGMRDCAETLLECMSATATQTEAGRNIVRRALAGRLKALSVNIHN